MVDSSITFQPQPEGQSTTECLDIPIIDNNILEANEMFAVELQSTNPSVTTNSAANRAMVIIMDDDSM